MSQHLQLDGPDWLDAMAQEAIAQGLSTNASEFSRRADQWRDHMRTLEASQMLVDSMSRGSDNVKRNAAHAYDQLSRVLPAEDDLGLYEQVRTTLSALGDVPFGPSAWGDRTESFGRNPRRMPMPGDRYFLPVEVRAASYKDNGMSVTYVPMLRNGSGHLEPKQDTAFCVLGCPTWPQGAIGVVSSPRAAFDECALDHITRATDVDEVRDAGAKAA